MTRTYRLTKWFLTGAIVFLSLAALLGIIALLGFQGNALARTLITTLAISGYSIIALACAIVLDRQQATLKTVTLWVARIGIALSLLGLAYAVTLTWLWDWFVQYIDDEPLIRTLGFLVLLPIYAAHASLILMPAKVSRRVRAVRVTAIVCSTLLTLEISLLILELEPAPEEFMFRLLGVLGILTASATLVLPILMKIDSMKGVESIASTATEVELRCPRCGTEQTIPVGRRRCAQCGLKMHIDLEEPKCAGCGYLLHKLEGLRCPECGREIPEEERWYAMTTDGRPAGGEPSPAGANPAADG